MIELPDGFRPEGIAIDPRGTAYLGSLADGDIYAADLRTGEGEVISQGPGTPSVGLKIDQFGRLFVSEAERATPVWSTPRAEMYSRRTSWPRSGIHQRCRADPRWCLVHEQHRRELYFLPVGPSGDLPDETES